MTFLGRVPGQYTEPQRSIVRCEAKRPNGLTRHFLVALVVNGRLQRLHNGHRARTMDGVVHRLDLGPRDPLDPGLGTRCPPVLRRAAWPHIFTPDGRWPTSLKTSPDNWSRRGPAIWTVGDGIVIGCKGSVGRRNI